MLGVAAMVGRRGRMETARALGIAPDTLKLILDGHAVRKATAALIRANLDAIAMERTET